MDALTHAIEAYVSTLNGPFTDPLALQAIEMVLDYLPASYNCNMDAREQMHYAQCLARNGIFKRTSWNRTFYGT